MSLSENVNFERLLPFQPLRPLATVPYDNGNTVHRLSTHEQLAQRGPIEMHRNYGLDPWACCDLHIDF